MSTVLVAEPGHVHFAPHLVRHDADGTVLYTTRCSADDLVFEPGHPTTPGVPVATKWFVGGRTHLARVEVTPRGTRIARLALAGADHEYVGASQVRLDDGRLRLWYSVRPPGGSWRIEHVDSADEGASWGAPRVALEATDGSEREHVLLPCVVRDGDRWLLYYAGRDGRNRRVHSAVSSDAEKWERRGVVLDLGPPGSIDEYATDCPAVVRGAQGFTMVYGAGSARCLAGATSTDGLTWHRTGVVRHRGPVGGPDSAYAFYPTLLAVGSGDVLCWAGEDDVRTWRVLVSPGAAAPPGPVRA